MLEQLREIVSRRPNAGPLSSFKVGSPTQQRIVSARIERKPYPHFIVDDVLAPETIDEMLANWPARPDFDPEIPHNYVCDLLDSRIDDRSKRAFWTEFRSTHGIELASAAAKQFAPWISAQYGPDVDVILQKVGLMESDPTYRGHDCHTHHYHDPCWIGTLLLYLDRHPNGYPGTTINQARLADLDKEAEMAAKTLHWHGAPDMEEFTTVEYRQNRLFAMFDSAISYHSVKSATPEAIGHRRIFRIHMKVPNTFIRVRYGVSRERYRAAREKASTDPIVLEWMKRDILQLRAVSSG